MCICCSSVILSECSGYSTGWDVRVNQTCIPSVSPLQRRNEPPLNISPQRKQETLTYIKNGCVPVIMLKYILICRDLSFSVFSLQYLSNSSSSNIVPLLMSHSNVYINDIFAPVQILVSFPSSRRRLALIPTDYISQSTSCHNVGLHQQMMQMSGQKH